MDFDYNLAKGREDMIEKWMRLFTSVLCVALIVGVVGCDDDSDSTHRDVTGTWSVWVQEEGNWTEEDRVTLTQSGATVSGTQQDNGLSLSGSVSGNTLTFTADQRDGTIATVVVSGAGDTLTGTTANADGSINGLRLIRI